MNKEKPFKAFNEIMFLVNDRENCDASVFLCNGGSLRNFKRLDILRSV